MNLQQYKDKFNQSKGKFSYLCESLEKEKKKQESLKEYLIAVEEAQTFLQEVAKETQNQLKFHINDLMNLCLNHFWPGEVEFDIIYESKRGKTEAKLCFLIQGEEIDPLESDGGGLVDIAAFGLRMVAWTLERTRNTIILDEPFKNLSNDLQEKGAELIKELSERLDLQFIIINHRPEITNIADKVFRVDRIKENDYYVSKVFD